MDKINFTVDKEKCIKCGLCVKDCITKVIELNDANIPYAKNDERCIKCQHCLAICPTGAISIFNKNPENSDICNNYPEEEKLLNLIKSRRSFRQYKSENLPKSVIDKLRNILKYPPTGCNFHKLHISIIDDIEVMDKFREKVNSKIRNILEYDKNNPITRKFSAYKDAFMNGEDIIFRDAPHMIVISTPINAPCATEDGIINLSNFELYAQAIGVGTLWCGFAQICLKLFPDLCEYLEIPNAYKPVYVMLFGAPQIQYQRTTQPEEYPITIVNDKEIKISLIQKLKRYFWNFIR